MTLRDKVKVENVKDLDRYQPGGVKGCPSDYSYLNKESEKKSCPRSEITNLVLGCRRCWNREFKEVSNE